jgi:hypothetical protein
MGRSLIVLMVNVALVGLVGWSATLESGPRLIGPSPESHVHVKNLDFFTLDLYDSPLIRTQKSKGES